MKFSEILKEMPNMKLGTKIKREDGQIYELMKTQNNQRKFGRLGNKKRQERFMRYTNIDKEFEVIEENKEIEELDDEIESYTDTVEQSKNKINELVRAVNKLIKEREEK